MPTINPEAGATTDSILLILSAVCCVIYSFTKLLLRTVIVSAPGKITLEIFPNT